MAKTTVLNVRIDERQARWLRRLAANRHSGNMSEAVREAITQAWLYRRVRDDYKQLEDEGFRFPTHADGLTRAIEVLLRYGDTMTWTDDDEEWD